MGRDGVVSGIYSGNRRYTGYCSFDQGIGGAGLVMKKDTQIWYVDSGKTSPTTSGDGLSPEGAFLTLLEAVTAAGNYDTIIVMQNAIATIATAGITITQIGLRILGCNGHPGRQAGALKKTVGTTAMFIISADRVEIAGLNLSMRTAGTCIQIGTATNSGGGIYQAYIHDCNFDGYDTALYAIKAYDDTVDAVNIVVENCFFKGHVTAAIYANSTRDTYCNNFFDVGADNTGIYVANIDGSRGYTLIYDNMFIGQTGTTTKAVDFAGNNTKGTVGVFRNLLAGDFNVTIDDNTGDPGCLNYQGSTTGGSLIDCNTSA